MPSRIRAAVHAVIRRAGRAAVRAVRPAVRAAVRRAVRAVRPAVRAAVRRAVRRAVRGCAPVLLAASLVSPVVPVPWAATAAA
ncbi:hypothetical protein, partial [Streptomyces javensis]|uniref:hypothetical protein n=1 Tax=Streptomyces javensis TaxID=114698 RepID=UPI003CD08D8E